MYSVRRHAFSQPGMRRIFWWNRAWSPTPEAAYALSYAYDQGGNRLTHTDNRALPAVLTSRHCGVDAGNTPETYGSWSNRLMWFETVQGESVLEKTWYAYNGAGLADDTKLDLIVMLAEFNFAMVSTCNP